MKIATFIHQAQRKVGLVNPELGYVECFNLDPMLAKLGGLSIIELLANGGVLPELGGKISLSEIKLEAPIPRPRRNVFCAGKNYLDHVKEVAKSGIGSGPTSGSEAPLAPIIFTKVPESVIGCGESILRHANVTQQLDYEAELAVVIGVGGSEISREDAMKHVWGYTIINDVSARDLQKRHQQWHLAKSLDGFCPMGPWMVSREEIDVNNTTIKCWVNSELRQNASTDQFIFDIPELIATISAGITLYPGDIIATGTPSGVGMGFKPPKFLQSGDCVKIEISGIGYLENIVE